MPSIPIFVLMGTAGCGKTSVALQLKSKLDCRYLEGDSLHPPANVKKMSEGHPLNDDDRWPWLREIRDHLAIQVEEVKNLPEDDHRRVIVVTCSSLRKAYRDILRELPEGSAQVIFVYLKGSKELLMDRISNRKDHFMPAIMLQSQLDTLEEPDPKTENVIVVDIDCPPEEEAKQVIKAAVEKDYIHSSAISL
ncbi:shikimate kinase [Blakeslea trispora]|nr:shikimate kinase [Blakeslea trispora]